MRRIQVWDLPTRIFHWALVVMVFLAWFTADLLDSILWLHQWIGIGIIGLVSFRIAWGFVGSTYARFSQFLVDIDQVKTYLKGEWHGVGHNPLGGWSVITMLALLSGLVITGLFANHHEFHAPFALVVGDWWSDVFTGIHEALFNVLFVVMLVHVLAMMVYKVILNKDLIQPMIDGHTLVDNDIDQSATGGGWLALLFSLGVAVLVMWLASGAWRTLPA